MITKEQMLYVVQKYSEVRYADRGLFFRKRRSKRVDPTQIDEVINYYSEGHTQGFFLKHDDVKYVIILGSNELIDWFYNFWFRFKETPYKEDGVRREIKVHKGFYRTYLKAREIILHEIQNDEKVFVYGQSLGGAVATLAALDIQYNYPDKEVALMTTGSPRLGNEEFKESFNKRVKDYNRFVYGGDIVTAVPPKWTGYRHVNDEIHLGPERRIRLSIPDHMMDKYIPAISAL